MGRGQAGNAICPSTLKLPARAINARGFSFRTCTSPAKEHHGLQHHSSGACDQILGQYCPGGQLLWHFRNCVSRFHLHIFQCSMLKIGCACVLVVTCRDSREGQIPLSCTCSLFPSSSLLSHTKPRSSKCREGSRSKGKGMFLSCKRQWLREICKSHATSFINDFL